MSSNRLSRFLVDRGPLAIAVLALYCWIAPTYIVDGDNAEFSTVAVTGGVAHPPGYPLYVLYLRAMSWLPGQTAAHTAALATAVIGAASMLVLHAACRAWGARPISAALAVAIVAAGPIVIRLNSAAEVFALNNLMVGLVLWLSARTGPLHGTRRVIALGLAAGLALANHHTCVLVAPIGLLGAVRGIRETAQSRVFAGVAGVLALAIGMTPYLYLFVASSPVSWGQLDSLSDLFAHFTRVDYGGAGAFSPHAGEIDVIKNITAFATTFGRAWLWLPAVAGVAMLARLVTRGSPHEPRVAWGMVAASWLLSGPLLAVRFNVEPSGLGLYIVQRFHLLAIYLIAPAVALAFDFFGERLARRWSSKLLARGPVRQAIVVGGFLAASGTALPYVLATHSPAVEKGVSNLLYSMPAGAVVIVAGDDLWFGSHYLQDVYGVRPDVVIVSWGHATKRWHLDSLARRGIVVDPHGSGTEQPSVRVARQILATHRPLFQTISPNNVLKALRSYPYGEVFRVLPPGSAMPSLDEIVQINQQVFASFDLAYPRPRADAEYAAATHQRYVGTWMILGGALNEAGRRDDALAARELAKQLEPVQ
jgi:hypothetical protein